MGVFLVLTAFDRASQRSFLEEEAEILQYFANAAAVVFDAAESRAQLSRMNETLEQQVRERTAELIRANVDLKEKGDALQLALRAMTRTQEAERKRMSQDLHDQLCQLIASSLCEVEAARVAVGRDDPDLTLSRLRTLERLSLLMDAECRRIIEENSPAVLARKGLLGALEDMLAATADRIADRDGAVRPRCDIKVVGVPYNLGRASDLALYRIAQETLNNIWKHAQANRISIELSYGAEGFRMLISDDGVGFDSRAALSRPNHYGLPTMKDRAESLGGLLSIRTGGECVGTEVEVAIPRSD